MPKIGVNKTATINAPVEKVYEAIADFHHWPKWSPWLIMEPGVKVDTREDGKYYEWEGDRTGSGNMTVISEKENESIDYDLVFLKPWKSKAKTGFKLKQNGDKTEIGWYMDSKLPFFMFWMKKMMEAFIGMDYERGLRLLTDYAEDGEIHSELDFKGTDSFNGCKFIGITTECTKETMGKKMAEDLPKLQEVLEKSGLEASGCPFTQYHKWDMVRNRVKYTSGIPVKEVPENLPSEFIVGEIPATKTYALGHKGPYPHLGNAWSTLYTMQRNKEFKLNKQVDPFELYQNNPREVEANELLTDIHFPIK